MQSVSSKPIAKTGIGNLPVVRKFRKVIENRDMSLMDKELYQFLNLYCGFIAHYNIYGFRETYAPRGSSPMCSSGILTMTIATFAATMPATANPTRTADSPRPRSNRSSSASWRNTRRPSV